MVGATADMVLQPWGAFLAGAVRLVRLSLTAEPFLPPGSVAGIVSTVGYKSIMAKLFSRLKIHDTCGVGRGWSGQYRTLAR